MAPHLWNITRVHLIAAAVFALALSALSCSGGPDGPKKKTGFDAANAFGYLEHLCRFGPRAPATESAKKAREYLVKELKRFTDDVTELPFEGEDPPSGKKFDLVNIFARLAPYKTRRVLLATHWDTRLWAERDPDPARRDDPILGANDGGSGVAVLLELARLFYETPPDVGVDIALFDGEDLGRPGSRDYCQGSWHFARKGGPYADYRPEFVIVVDLVGDRDLDILKEKQSLKFAPELVARLWETADRLGHGDHYHREPGTAILDDHAVLHTLLGVPSVLLLDWNYGPDHRWFHTHQDTLDKCSADSLEAVGAVVAAVVYEWTKE